MSNILSKPKYGWCSIKLDDRIISASYLDDIPYVWLECIEFGLRTCNPICLKADGESAGTRYIIIDGILVTLVDNEQSYFIHELDGKEVMKDIILDIEENIEDWTDWLSYDDMTEKQRERRKKTLLKLVDKARKAYNKDVEVENKMLGFHRKTI